MSNPFDIGLEGLVLPKPLIFILNFGNVPTIPSLEHLSCEANATWINYSIPFFHENPHAEQARYALQEILDEILKYAETGIPPSNEI